MLRRFGRRAHLAAPLAHEVPGLAAWVTWSRQGHLQVHGHHLMRGDQSPFGFDAEYEYTISLSEAESVELARQLGLRRPRDLVDALVERSPELMARGEQHWLKAQLGQEATDLWTYLNPL